MKVLINTNDNIYDIFIKNEFYYEYLALLQKNVHRIKNNSDLHHIIPRCYYRHYNLEINSNNENLIYLSHKDHCYAHYLLAKCGKEKWFIHANAKAVIRLCYSRKINRNFNLNNIFFKNLINDLGINNCYNEPEELKQKISNGNKGHIVSEETKKKISLAKKGHIVLEETRKILSLKNKGKHHSEETKRKISESHKGKISYIPTEETRKKQSLAQKGKSKPWLKGKPSWIKGKCHSEKTKEKMSKSAKGKNYWTKGTIYVNNCLINLRINPNDLEKYISKGFHRGMLNKNKKEENNENIK